MSDNTLDLNRTDTKVLTEEISDEALEAAAEMDQVQRAITLNVPIWCPDSSGGPQHATRH